MVYEGGETGMREVGFSATAVGILTIWAAANTESLNLPIGGAGFLLLVIGMAMILYQSYREEELEAERLIRKIEQRKKDAMFRKWMETTDLKG